MNRDKLAGQIACLLVGYLKDEITKEELQEVTDWSDKLLEETIEMSVLLGSVVFNELKMGKVLGDDILGINPSELN